MSLLQDILMGRPIILYRVDGHAMLVSQKVLDLLAPLPDEVEGGEIVRDAEGRPTGMHQLFLTCPSLVAEHVHWPRHLDR
jgi:predicted amidohydrolase YtcJ